MNVGIFKVLDSKTKFKKNKILNLRKKESFQFVPETANGKFRVPQIVRKRVPKCGRGMKEAAGPIVFVLVGGTIRRRSWSRAERSVGRVDDIGAKTQ